MSYLVDQPLDLARLVAAVSAPARGGIACFVGVVRDQDQGKAVRRLEYSAYGPMAELECERIVTEARERWEAAVALEHRVGTLEVGDAAVTIAAAAAHRDTAFAACRYVIEQVKRRVPIWKREQYADGTVAWVDPTRARRSAAEPQPAVEPAEGPGQTDWGV
jgi:molybdopterin synthase catalytic subunit